MDLQNPFQRILLKLSGESLRGEQPFGINPIAVEKTAKALAKLQASGMEVSVVIGGGNIYRASSAPSQIISRIGADQIGMTATLLNGIALKEALKKLKAPAILMSSFSCPSIAEDVHPEKAQRYLNEQKIVIFVGGTGLAYFTTDTAAAVRALEVEAQILAKATKVDGVYDKDPKKYRDAKKYHHLCYSTVLAKKLEFMDATAVAMCQTNDLPIFVFHMEELLNENATTLPPLEAGTVISASKFFKNKF